MMGTFFLISLALMLLYKFLLSINKINAADFKERDWPRVGKYVAVLAVIILCEALAPSFRLTGLKQPVMTSPLRHLDSIPLSDGSLTYAEFAERAPWAWSLGYVSPSDMERRIDEDIVVAGTMLEETKKLAEGLGQYSVYGRAFGGWVPQLTAYIEGLHAARADLDALFVTPQRLDAPFQTSAKADVFISDHVYRIAIAQRVTAEAAVASATDAIAQYRLQKGEAFDGLAREYGDLLGALSRANEVLSNTYGPMFHLNDKRNETESRNKAYSAGQVVPAFNRAVQVVQQRIVIRVPLEPITAPLVPWTFVRSARAVQDAVTGRIRAGPNAIDEHRCAIAVVDVAGVPTPQKICEAAVVVPVNYDLTALTCEEGTGADVCNESWIFPHLNVIYEKDRFTVYTPRPTLGTAPVSVWYATWNGVEQALTPTATFMWDGASDVLVNLALRHDAKPQASKVLIWDDMRNVTADGGMKEGQEFKPTHLSGLQLPTQNEIAPFFMALDAAVAQDPLESDWQLSILRTSFQKHQDQLKLVASDVRKSTNIQGTPMGALDLIVPCGYHRFTRGAVEDTEMMGPMWDVVVGDAGQACEAVLGYATLLKTLERTTSGGSWLWLLKLDS